MPKETARKYEPPVHIPLPFVQTVTGAAPGRSEEAPAEGEADDEERAAKEEAAPRIRQQLPGFPTR